MKDWEKQVSLSKQKVQTRKELQFSFTKIVSLPKLKSHDPMSQVVKEMHKKIGMAKEKSQVFKMKIFLEMQKFTCSFQVQ